MTGGRVSGSQVRSRYAASWTTNAAYRERIRASQVGAAEPACSRPQQSAYVAERPQGHGEAGVIAVAGAMWVLAAEVCRGRELRRDMAPL